GRDSAGSVPNPAGLERSGPVRQKPSPRQGSVSGSLNGACREYKHQAPTSKDQRNRKFVISHSVFGFRFSDFLWYLVLGAWCLNSGLVKKRGFFCKNGGAAATPSKHPVD